jgi:DNA-binding GntR family transcriptional regulator
LDIVAAPVSGTKLRRGQVQDEVLAKIRHGLMVGAFVPGQVMSLRKLAAHLGTSPMPVREALSQLVAANVLESLPNRSIRVPRLSAARLQEVTDVRIAIEGMATKAACGKATPRLIDELERLNRTLIQAIARRSIVQCLSTNQEFHFTLYEAAQSEVLMPLIEALWLQCGPTMYFSLLSPDMPWDASAHTEILSALRSGDCRQAERAMARDIRTTAKNLMSGPSITRSNGPLASPLDGLTLYLPPLASQAAAGEEEQA